MSKETCHAGHVRCPNAQMPDGDVCPKCKRRRGPSGVDGGSWVHYPPYYATCGTLIGQDCKEAPYDPENDPRFNAEDTLEAPPCDWCCGSGLHDNLFPERGVCSVCKGTKVFLGREAPQPEKVEGLSEEELTGMHEYYSAFPPERWADMQALFATIRAKDDENQKLFRQLIKTELQRDGYRKVDQEIAANERAESAEVRVKELKSDVYDSQYAVGVLEAKVKEREAENERLRDLLRESRGYLHAAPPELHLEINGNLTPKEKPEETPNAKR